jgi:hypothetical protein
VEFHLIRLFQRAIYLLMSVSLVATPAFAGETIKDKYGYSITREFVLHQSSGDKKIEVFWAKPSGDGPWPTLFLLHGHQQGIVWGGTIRKIWVPRSFGEERLFGCSDFSARIWKI